MTEELRKKFLIEGFGYLFVVEYVFGWVVVHTLSKRVNIRCVLNLVLELEEEPVAINDLLVDFSGGLQLSHVLDDDVVNILVVLVAFFGEIELQAYNGGMNEMMLVGCAAAGKPILLQEIKHRVVALVAEDMHDVLVDVVLKVRT